MPATRATERLREYLEQRTWSLREAARRFGEPNHSRIAYILNQGKTIPQDILAGISRLDSKLALELINLQHDEALEAFGTAPVQTHVPFGAIALGPIGSSNIIKSIRAIIRETIAGLRGDRPTHETIHEAIDIIVEAPELYIPRGALIPLSTLGDETVSAIRTAWGTIGQNGTEVGIRKIVEIGERHASTLQGLLQLQDRELGVVDPIRLAAQPYHRQEEKMSVDTKVPRTDQSQARQEPSVTHLHSKTAVPPIKDPPIKDVKLRKQVTSLPRVEANLLAPQSDMVFRAEQRDPLELDRLPTSDAAACLTEVCSKTGQGALTGYFAFKAGQLLAADYGAYRPDGRRLRDGFSVVESEAVRVVCRTLDKVVPSISRPDGAFGEFLGLTMGFAKSIITVMIAAPQFHLIGITHPKEKYRYGVARAARRDLLDLLSRGEVPHFTTEQKAAWISRDPFGPTNSELAGVPQAPAFANLLAIPPKSLSELFSRDKFCDPHRSGISGFVLFEQDKTKNGERVIYAASDPLVAKEPKANFNFWLRDEYAPVASPAIAQTSFSALLEAQKELQAAIHMREVTGMLRTFWLSFTNAVVGINPFVIGRYNSDQAQFFLASVYHIGADSQVRFNYELARRSIRAVCEDAAILT